MALHVKPLPQPLSFPIAGDAYRLSGLANGRQTIVIPDKNIDPTIPKRGVMILSVVATGAATTVPQIAVASGVSVTPAQEVVFDVVCNNAPALDYVMVLVF